MFERSLVRVADGFRLYQDQDFNSLQGLYLCGQGTGDIICMLPLVQKIAKVLKRELTVWTFRPEVFRFHPGILVKRHNEEEMKKTLSGGGALLVSPVTRAGEAGRHQMHLIDHSARDIVALSDEEKTLRFYSEGAAERKAEVLLNPLMDSGRYVIVVHANQNVPARTWPAAQWRQLVQALLRQYAVVLVGRDMQHQQSATETHYKRTISFDDEHRFLVNLINRLRLHELYEVIKKSHLTITSDSGVLHVAGCTDVPIIALFTNIDPRWRMRYRHGVLGYETYPIYESCEYQFCDSLIGPNGDRCRFDATAPQYMQCLPGWERVVKQVKDILGKREASLAGRRY